MSANSDFVGIDPREPSTVLYPGGKNEKLETVMAMMTEQARQERQQFDQPDTPFYVILQSCNPAKDCICRVWRASSPEIGWFSLAAFQSPPPPCFAKLDCQAGLGMRDDTVQYPLCLAEYEARKMMTVTVELAQQDGLDPKRKGPNEYGSSCPVCGGRDRFLPLTKCDDEVDEEFLKVASSLFAEIKLA